MRQMIVSISEVLGRWCVQLKCGHWVKLDKSASPRIGEEVFCQKCGG